MKTFLIIFSVFVLASCSKTHDKLDANYSMPEEMNDCSIFKLVPDNGGRTLYAIRCPNSTTTTSYRNNKTNVTTSVIDDNYTSTNKIE